MEQRIKPLTLAQIQYSAKSEIFVFLTLAQIHMARCNICCRKCEKLECGCNLTCHLT
ncbi:hypothetical protein VW13_002185 [Salmonella enterica subsp. salamae]|uniref:Uncharacterized protein n=1 Tax=Salmonella enterica subsp. salamae serovar 58:d:z6 TaxID=41517 RepID=A0A737SAK4_SALER|nr:hypothetical protein [Salmonella enterica subsp. salamae]EEJ4442236.1 hypothetical protein [Salmonella enterica subsp. salamae serovar 50:b:z6]HAE2715504.1 hypothetical protein [Salmonella enterica subsp. salamae serovar 58:d:z6]EDX9716174.1 hypothetical protein [Salmonella enterica subsp. salamae]EDY4732160.1 hypothetical protein [Salmonella enterica subsp. salamae]